MKTSVEENTVSSVQEVKLSQIVASDYNQRRYFDEQALRELSENISQFGVLQPVLLRKKGKKFEIVYGERRFRAAQMAGLSTIPANIRELTDEQALEISVIENLQRENIKPMEEASGFIALLETKKYDYTDLALKIGKSEAYVRNRVKLRDLIPEIAQMIDREEINIGTGLCVATYCEDTQRDVYDNHLRSKGYTWWGNLSTKDFKATMENAYSLLLENYDFEKSSCTNCPHNTNMYSIFRDETEGKCTKRACLIERNSEYMVQEAIRNADKEHIQYVRVDHTNLVSDSIFGLLEKEGLIFLHDGLQYVSYPEAPEYPNTEDFDTEEEFQIAIVSFKAESETYEEEKADFDAQIADGNIVKCLKFRRNRVQIGYFVARKEEKQTSQEVETVSDVQDTQETPLPVVNHSAQIRKLQQQDKRNQEICVENTLNDAKQLIKNVPHYSGDLSDLELKMMYFFMSWSVSRDKERLLMPEKDFPTYHDKLKFIEKMTVENMNLIVREYLRVNFNQQASSIADHFLAFVHQHCPESLAEVSQKYRDVYEKRKKRIDEQITELTPPVSEPYSSDDEIEQEFSEIQSDGTMDEVQLPNVA